VFSFLSAVPREHFLLYKMVVQKYIPCRRLLCVQAADDPRNRAAGFRLDAFLVDAGKVSVTKKHFTRAHRERNVRQIGRIDQIHQRIKARRHPDGVAPDHRQIGIGSETDFTAGSSL